MKCHYEVLNLQRNADDAEIKSAYRKLALQWHPDKNMDNPERAKEQFQYIQQAYEVLSDAHERAWYDNHREQILRGGDSGYEDNSLDVFQYFTASCYKGFGDNVGSFYQVYGEVFKTIATEDIEYMDSEDEFAKIPFFGSSSSNYEDIVGPFYNYWLHYSTKKSYAWLCPHNIAEIRDRRILKTIEKEAKKIQQRARKERNEAVRNLVAFVRKRDKRVKVYKEIQEAKAKENKAKQEKDRLEKIQQRHAELQKQIKKNHDKVDETYEEQLRQLESAYTDSEYDESEEDFNDEIESDSNSVEGGVESLNLENNENEEELDEEDIEIDDLYCVACKKEFKSYDSYQNHESSKKHRENIHKLKKSMKKDEKEYIKNSENFVSKDNNDDHIEKDEDQELNSEDETMNSEEEFKNNVERKKSKKKNKTRNKNMHYDSDNGDEIDEVGVLTPLNNENNDENWEDEKQNGKKGKKSKKASKDKITPKPNISILENENTSAKDDTNEIRQNSSKSVSKKTKQKLLTQVVPQIDSSEIDTDHICVTCTQEFESKNKLFIHMKKMNHAVYIPKAPVENLKKKGKKK